MSMWGLSFFIQAAESEFLMASSTFIHLITNGSNVNRLGLILQFVGIFSALPELVKRSNSERWEKWFHNVDPNKRIVKFSIRNLFLIEPADILMTRGTFGLINLVSRSIMFYFLAIALQALWKNVSSFDFNIEFPVRGQVSILSVFLTVWLFSTLYDLRNALRNVESSKGFRLFYLLPSSPLIAISPFIYIPTAFMVLIVLSALRGISEYSIEQIITRTTFPFVLLGSLLELLATFMQW